MQRSILFLAALLAVIYTAGCAATPRPLTDDQIRQRVDDDLTAMFADQEPVNGPIGIYEAMARAIRHNLDHRLKLMETALANRQLDVARYEQLPRLTAAAGYTTRNNYSGSSSRALTGPGAGQESLVTSTSQERDLLTGEVTATWNVLDFGVSYLRARQQTDRILILEERRRKVIQNMVQDVRQAFWRAATAETLLREMNDLRDQATTALKRSEQILAQRLKPPRELLEYQRTLLENIRLLWELIQQLAPAKTELATLMNLRPGTDYRLAIPAWGNPILKVLDNTPEALVQSALENRPELREEDLRARISALDARRAIVEMLPGLRFDLGYNYDSNDFLYNNDWWRAGTHVSMNLFKLVSGPAAYKSAKAQQRVGDLRRQALSLAVMTQVHLALQRYGLAREEYLLAQRLDGVNQRLQKQMASAEAVGRVDDLAVIRSATQALVARMRHYRAFAALQNAAGRIYNSLGTDPFPQALETMSLSTMTQTLKETFGRLERMETKPENSAPTESAAPKPDAAVSRPPDREAMVAETEKASEVPAVVESDADSIKTGPAVASAPVPAKAPAAALRRREAMVTGDRVNLRRGPALTEPVIAQIEFRGTRVEVLERRDDWFRIAAEGDQGWMVEDYLLVRPAAPGEPSLAGTGRINASGVLLRESPTTRSSVLTRIENSGLRVRIIEDRDNWLRIALNGQEGWVFGLFVDADLAGVDTPPVWGEINAFRVNLRKGPAATHGVTTNIGKRGSRVRILDFQDHWYRVLAGSIPGWIHQKLVDVSR